MSTLNPNDIDRIQDYIDGELPDDDMRTVADKLNRNPEWRAEEERLRALIRQVQALPKDIDPGRDLWRGIDRRIAEAPPENVVPFSRRLVVAYGSIAAALLVVMSVSFVALNQDNPGQTPVAPPSNATGPGNPQVQFASFHPDDAEYELALAEYKSATDALHQSISERRDSMEEETWIAVSESLNVIHQAIQDIEAALEADPESPELRSMLVAAYEKEVGLLRQVVLL